MQSAILVTGAHRSGTTWLGRMLAASPRVRYLHEPFSVIARPGGPAPLFEHWYTYLTEENGSPFYGRLRERLACRYDVRANMGRIHPTWRAMQRVARVLGLYVWYQVRGPRPLMKDPVALLSADWLARSFGMRVVVMIRHPAAFASSLMRLNFRHPFSDFLAQPLLMRDCLHPFEAEIADFAAREREILDQAILLWRILYSVVARYQAEHPEWIFLRHEDVSCDPIGRFRALFGQLGLPFTPPVQRTIAESCQVGNPAEVADGGSVRLDSRAAAQIWKKRLTESEIRRIRAGVEEVAARFYSDEEW